MQIVDLSCPYVKSAVLKVGLNSEGVAWPVLSVETELPIFPDQDGFDAKAYNSLLTAVGIWQAANRDKHAYIIRVEP